MFKNYLKIAFRNIYRQKKYSIINIAGLSIGLAAAIMIILFVTDEIYFDSFNHNIDRISRLITTSQSPDKTLRNFSLTPGILGQRLKENYPEVEDYTTIIDRQSWGRFTVEHGENKYYESEYLITGPSFLKIFDFEIIKGERNKLLTEPNEMVLTESTAKKLFGNENPIGKTIKTDRQWGDFKITGILKDPPTNSHLRFSMLISIKSLDKLNGFVRALNNLDASIVRTYLLFKPGYKIQNFAGKLREFQNSNKGKSFGVTDIISQQSLGEVHFNSQNIEFDLNSDVRSKSTLYILAVIGLLIILVAAINYANLSAAKSMNRIKEIGIRKVVGADKKQLVQQFLVEAVLITGIALAVALVIVLLALPSFNTFTGKSLSLFGNSTLLEILVIITLTILIGLLSGILPALIITKLKTVSILTGKARPGRGFTAISKGLVAMQFTVSILMIFCTVTIYKQLQYVRTKELGFDKENLLVIDINNSGTRRNFETIKNEFSKSPDVKSVSVSSRIPGDWKNLAEVQTRNFGEDKQLERKMFYIGADSDFLKTFRIDLISGRNFDTGHSGDSLNVMINREAALALGLKDPIGKSVAISSGETSGVYTIIGLVKDFNFQSLHEKISPMIIGNWNNPFEPIDYFTAKIRGTNLQETIKYLVSVQNKFDKATPFEYNFLDERIKDFYKQDEREATIINFSSGLALLIASLGLFGLAAFSAERRTKEIGVRKVLGASISGIVILFSADYLKLVLVASVISFPAAYYLMQTWLDGFAYKISIGWQLFLISALITAIIALATISYHSIKSSLINPTESLRYE